MIATLSRQGGTRYPYLHSLPGVPFASYPVAGQAPEVRQTTSLSGKTGLRPLLAGIVGLRSYFEGKAGLK